MAHVKRSLQSSETTVYWVLGTRPGGRYLATREPAAKLSENRENAVTFLSEAAAREHRAMGVPKDVASTLTVIRVAKTVRETCHA